MMDWQYLKKIINNQFFRFIFISGVNTLFGLGVFYLSIFLGLHYSLAIFFATVLGVLFNFQTISRVVFSTYQDKLLFKFILVYCGVYLLNTGGVGILIHFHLGAYWAGTIMALPVGVAAFLLNKKFVFNSRSS
jgi:putative flippase GtrA